MSYLLPRLKTSIGLYHVSSARGFGYGGFDIVKRDLPALQAQVIEAIKARLYRARSRKAA